MLRIPLPLRSAFLIVLQMMYRSTCTAVLQYTSTMEVERRVYGGGNITFFHPPPLFLIDYYISTMIHLHYGGGSYNIRWREHYFFASTAEKNNTLLY